MHVCRHISKIHTTVLTFLFDYVDMMWSLTLREVSTRTYEPAAMMSHALRLRQRSLYGLSLVALTSLGGVVNLSDKFIYKWRVAIILIDGLSPYVLISGTISLV